MNYYSPLATRRSPPASLQLATRNSLLTTRYSLLAVGGTKGGTRPTLRSGCWQAVCPHQPGWPVDRTAWAVAGRNPSGRLRTEPSMRSVAGISGLQAGEDVKPLPSRETGATAGPANPVRAEPESSTNRGCHQPAEKLFPPIASRWLPDRQPRKATT